MKKLIIIFSMLFCVVGMKAQINFEHSYRISSTTLNSQPRIVHFSSLGYKYALVSATSTTGTISIYNLNHSLFKTMIIPTMPSSINALNVYYISDSLFNTNPANIEYLVEGFGYDGGHVRIFDDMGNTLFSRDTVYLNPYDGQLPNTEPIFYTPNGYKMVFQQSLFSGYDTTSYVYSLPGALPCGECANGNEITTASPNTQQNNSGGLMNAYPNPAKNSTTIKYELPHGINQGDIVFYDLKGNEVKTFTVDRTFDSLLVSTADLAAGTYFYILRAGGNYVGSKKVVIIK